MKRPAKGRRKDKDTFTATEVGTLIERLEGGFKIFGERQATIIEKLDATHEQVVKNTEDIALLKVAAKKMATKEDLTNMATKIEALTESIDRLIKTKADREEFLTLERRVSTLENKVASLS